MRETRGSTPLFNLSLIALGSLGSQKAGNPSSSDPDRGAFRHEIEEFHDLVVPHAHASVAHGLSEEIFLVGAVNVDVAVMRVGIVLIQAHKPEDTTEDEVLLAFITQSPFSDGLPPFENGAQGGFMAKLLTDLELSQGRAIAPFLTTRAIGGCRNDVVADFLFALIESKTLLLDGDFNPQIAHSVHLLPVSVSLHHSADLAFETHFGCGRHAIDEQLAMQMIRLVLDSSTKQAISLDD